MNQYKYIPIPAQQVLDDGTTVDFVEHYIGRLLGDVRFGQSMALGRMRGYIREAFQGLTEGDVARLRTEEATMLSGIAVEPRFGSPASPHGYHPDHLEIFLRWGWVEAVETPLDEDPTLRAVEEAEAS